MSEVTQPAGEFQFNPANKTNAIIAWIPIIGLIFLFTEKKDQFVRYCGAQSTVLAIIFTLISILLSVLTNIFFNPFSYSSWGFISIMGTVSTVLWVVYGIALIMGMVKASSGEMFKVPVVAGMAKKLMGMIK